MDFAVKLNDGHLGPRKFWRHYLPRLKYHNPAVPMTVNRTTNQSGPATLTVFFAPPPDSQSPTSSPAPTSSTSQSTSPSEHTPFERAQSIDLKHRREPEIMALLMATTKATPVHATAEEQAELEELEEQRERSERDTARSAEVNAKRKREAEVLAQARGELAQAQAQAV